MKRFTPVIGFLLGMLAFALTMGAIQHKMSVPPSRAKAEALPVVIAPQSGPTPAPKIVYVPIIPDAPIGNALEGLNRMAVTVKISAGDHIKNEIFGGSFTDFVRQDAELKLRRAGITIIPVNSETSLILEITLGVAPENPTHVLSGAISVRLDAGGVGPNGKFSSVFLWDSASAVSVGDEQAGQMRGAIADDTDAFLNAWLEANPATINNHTSPASHQ